VSIHRCPGDLRIAWKEAEAPPDAAMEVAGAETLEGVEALGSEGACQRYAFRPDRDLGLRLEPALADQPLVVRPEIPLFIPGGEAVSLFVSNPLWLRVVGDPLGTLLDIPLRRPSLTWFGPNPVSGELCYATRTHPRLHLENVVVPVSRAVTPVRVVNRAESPLALERLKIPVPHLELFATAAHTLWTSAVEVKRSSDGSTAEVHFLPGAPEHAAGATSLAPPRSMPEGPDFVRALSSLFG
jgi:hypothetical protein